MEDRIMFQKYRRNANDYHKIEHIRQLRMPYFSQGTEYLRDHDHWFKTPTQSNIIHIGTHKQLEEAGKIAVKIIWQCLLETDISRVNL